MDYRPVLRVRTCSNRAAAWTLRRNWLRCGVIHVWLHLGRITLHGGQQALPDTRHVRGVVATDSGLIQHIRNQHVVAYAHSQHLGAGDQIPMILPSPLPWSIQPSATGREPRNSRNWALFCTARISCRGTLPQSLTKGGEWIAAIVVSPVPHSLHKTRQKDHPRPAALLVTSWRIARNSGVDLRQTRQDAPSVDDVHLRR